MGILPDVRVLPNVNATFQALQVHFGNDGLLQLTGAIGYSSMLAMTANACELEAAPGAEVLEI